MACIDPHLPIICLSVLTQMLFPVLIHSSDLGYEGVRSKMAYFMFRPSCQDQKDTNKFLTPLACEALFKQFYLLYKHYI